MLAVIGRSLPVEESNLPDSFNVLSTGILDSFGFIELLAAVEERFDIEIDLSDLDPEQLGEIGALARHIAQGGGRP
jgi:acyl carrier protein